MSELNKYKGIFPAMYACYDDKGNISYERTEDLINYYIKVGVKGVYITGSSGECIYQTLEERKETVEAVMKVARGKLIVIAHIAAPNTRDSIRLAKHAESLGVDGLSAIPPIYFPLSDASVEKYWSEMAQSTSLDFFIYNIPQLTNYTLSPTVYKNMLKIPQVVGIKNSSKPGVDILTKKLYADKEVIVFNGCDEQHLGALSLGADGGIGSTHSIMPKLFLKVEELFYRGEMKQAFKIQCAIYDIMLDLKKFSAHPLSVSKSILKYKGINIGEARLPLAPIKEEALTQIITLAQKIDQATTQFC